MKKIVGFLLAALVWAAPAFAQINGGVYAPPPSLTTIVGTLSVSKGGTNITSYTVGDLLYASGTTTLSTRAAVATGSVLLSQGVGVAPIWGAVPATSLATQATNTILGNATSGAAAPTALAIGSCDTATKAVQWTTNTGFGCNSSITAAAVPASGLTGTTLASGVTASSLTSVGASLVVNGATIGTNAMSVAGVVEFTNTGTNPQYAFGVLGAGLTTGNTISMRIGKASAVTNQTLLFNYNYDTSNSALVIQHFGDASGISLTKGGRVDVLGPLVTAAYTVATLPSTAILGKVAGARAHVTDQLTTCAAPGAAVTGGGTLTCPVFYNGSAWVGG